MRETDEAAKTSTESMSVSGSVPLALLGLMFLGLFPVGVATMDVPSSVFVLAAAPGAYLITMNCGLLLALVGFGIVESRVRRGADPARGWARVARMLAIALPFGFVIAGLLAGPAVALGISAIGLGSWIGLSWSAPQPRGRVGAYLALLLVSIALVLVAVWSLAVLLQGVPWDAPG